MCLWKTESFGKIMNQTVLRSSCCCEVILVNVSQAWEWFWPLDNQIKNKVWDFLQFGEIAMTFTSLVSLHTMACDTQCSHSKLPHIALSDLRAKNHYWVSQQSTIRSTPPEHQQHRSSLLPRHKLSDRLLHSSLYSRHNKSPAYFLIRVLCERRGEWNHLLELGHKENPVNEEKSIFKCTAQAGVVWVTVGVV